MRAKYPILNVVTWEERRLEETLAKVCQGLGRTLHVWTVTQGMRPPLGASRPSNLPGELEALALVHEAPEYTVFLLKDFHPYLKDHRVVRLLRDLAGRLRGRAQTLVLVGPVLQIPPDLEKDITVLDFPLPDATEIGATLDRVIAAVGSNPQVDVTLEPMERELLIKSAQGLTMDEIESVLARSLVENRKLDLHAVLKEKQQIIRKSGTLEYTPPDAKLKDVGGMENLKEWLEKRNAAFTDKARAFGIPAPKGILLLGVQGCGKSLTAKAVAAQWDLPLLRLDIGRIFGSYVGESEENMRKAIRTAEGVAPCILWTDELEKGFGGMGSSNDSGTSSRVFASFLTWMSEKTSPVFIIATANDVSKLPPELLRKGRFDEIFFVDLPDSKEREEIFKIHLEKRGRPAKKYRLGALSAATVGYSGAEIEQVVVGALYTAFDAERELSQKDLIGEAGAVVPLSVMMGEQMQELRDWASTRTRPASRNDDAPKP